jgi:putative inorganic carbon (HCO3(-)) transporter
MKTLKSRFSTFESTEQYKLIAILLISAIPLYLGYAIAFNKGLMPLIAIIAVDVLLLALIVPEVATLVFAFMLYINLPAVATRFHGVPATFSSSFFFILLLPLASYVIIRRKALVFTPALPWILVYFVALITSAFFTQTISQSASWINNFVTEGLLLYLLFSNVIRGTKSLRRVIWVLLLAGSLMSALSIYQEITHTYSNNYGGFAQIDKVIDDTSTGELIRLAGPVGEKNRYAQVLLVLLPLGFFRFRGEKSRLLRILAIAATLLILAGALLTYSRGAMIAIFAILIIMIIWGYIRIDQAIFAFLAFIALITIVAPRMITRLESIQYVQSLYSEGGTQADGAIRGRTTENLAALYVFLDHPVVGVGPGQFFEQYSQDYANTLGIRFLETTRRAHNLYLETAADTGLFGICSFMAILLVTLYQLSRLRKFWMHQRPDLSNMAAGFLLSVLAYMASAVFLHLSFARYFWFLIALANVAIYVIQLKAVPEAVLATAPTPATEVEHTPLVRT